MLLSLLIERLQQALAQHGDMPVCHWTGASPQTPDTMVGIRSTLGPVLFIGSKGSMPSDQKEPFNG